MQCCSCTRRSKTKILTTKAPLSWIEFDVARHNVKLKVLPTVWCYLNRLLETLKRCFGLLQEINKRRNMEINNDKPYSRCRVWRCDVTTTNSIQDGGALVVNILVFDLRVQLQHCTHRGKTILFALIKVNTFICKREISGISSPLRRFSTAQHLSTESTFFVLRALRWNELKIYSNFTIEYRFARKKLRSWKLVLEDIYMGSEPAFYGRKMFPVSLIQKTSYNRRIAWFVFRGLNFHLFRWTTVAIFNIYLE